jgi:hypothetical protein
MTNSTTNTTIDIQSLIFHKELKRFSSFSSKCETKLQGVADFNIHKKLKKAFECLLITTDVINLNKGSYHERASVRAIRLSISMRKEKKKR